MKRTKQLIPGYGLTATITYVALAIIVIIPFISLIVEVTSVGWSAFIKTTFQARVLASYAVSIKGALLAALINTVLGLVIAWVLTFYKFPGRKLIDSIMELPFILPTAVAGIALAYLYSDKGWFGQLLAPMNVKVSYTFAGIVIAMVFVTIPFVVRELQPILEQLDVSSQEAALTLGASTPLILRKIIFPEIFPALLAGFGLAFARSLGEYGSIVFIAGNQPYKTEITPLLIMFQLQEHNYGGATSIAIVMLVFSFLIMYLIHYIQQKVSQKK
jgi:sulfate transport system permease protein